MKSELYGTLTLAYSIETNAETTDLAKLEAAYKIDESIISQIEVIIINVNGVRTPVKIHNWNNDFDEAFNKNGTPLN